MHRNMLANKLYGEMSKAFQDQHKIRISTFTNSIAQCTRATVLEVWSWTSSISTTREFAVNAHFLALP